MSSSSALAASVLRSPSKIGFWILPPYDKSTSNRYRSSCFLCRVLTGSSFTTARKNLVGSTNNQREDRSLIEGSPYLSWSAPGHTPLNRALSLFFVFWEIIL